MYFNFVSYEYATAREYEIFRLAFVKNFGVYYFIFFCVCVNVPTKNDILLRGRGRVEKKCGPMHRVIGLNDNNIRLNVI